MHLLHRLSKEKAWQQMRRANKWEARRQVRLMALGKQMQEERDSGKRTYDEMTDEQQLALEEHETERAEKCLKELRGETLPRFQAAFPGPLRSA